MTRAQILAVRKLAAARRRRDARVEVDARARIENEVGTTQKAIAALEALLEAVKDGKQARFLCCDADAMVAVREHVEMATGIARRILEG